jgi:Ca2+-binding RTX toxin-like protein
MALVGVGTLRPVQGHNGNYECDIFPVDQHKHDPFEGDMSPNWVVEEGENDTRNGCYDGLQDFVPFGYDDDIEAGAGRDYIIVRDGNDRVVGEKGADWILGGPGHDFLSGGEGDDIIYDGKQADEIKGGSGFDILRQCDDGAAPDEISGVEQIVGPLDSYCNGPLPG